MAIKKIELRPKSETGKYEDIIYPKTSIDMVDGLQTALNAKASTTVATTSTNGLMAFADKTKLDGVASGANNYTHPINHPPSIITQDASNRFVTDAEKTAWNAKASTTIVTTSTNGLMSNTDKLKLDGIAPNANNYVLPTKPSFEEITANTVKSNDQIKVQNVTFAYDPVAETLNFIFI